MHRPSRVPRSLVLTTLLSLAALLGLGVPHAGAQGKGTAVPVPINGSQIIEMSEKQRIKDIENQDQNIARVDYLQGSDLKKVMDTAGVTPALSQLTGTDLNGTKEYLPI